MSLVFKWALQTDSTNKSSVNCVSKSGLEITEVTAFCKVNAFGSQCGFGFSCLFSLNLLENKSYTSIRTEALSVIQLLLTRLQGESFYLPPGRATAW